MGCDGIWERFSNEEITEFIQERMNKDQTLESIVT